MSMRSDRADNYRISSRKRIASGYRRNPLNAGGTKPDRDEPGRCRAAALCLDAGHRRQADPRQCSGSDRRRQPQFIRAEN